MTAASTYGVGAIGMGGALALVPVAFLVGGAWFLLPLAVATCSIIYLWRPS